MLSATAWADVLCVSETEGSPEYIYKIHGGRQNTTTYWGELGGNVAAASASEFAFFAATNSGEYYIYNVSTKKYLSYEYSNVTSSGTDKAVSADKKENAHTWKISTVSSYPDYFQLQPTSSSETTATEVKQYANWYGGVGSTHTSIGLNGTDGNGDAGSAWTFEPVAGTKYGDVTYNLSTADGGSYTGTAKGFAGKKVIWTTPDVATFSNETWSEDGKTYSATVAGSVFPFSSSADKAQTYRYIGIKSSSDRLLSASGDYIVMSTGVLPTNQSSVEDSYEWAMILSSVNNGAFAFKIMNKGGKFISTEGVTVNSPSSYVKLAETGTEFYYGPCIGTGNGFYVTSTSNFLSINSPNNTDQKVFLWTKSGSTHQGSNIGFFTPTDFDALMTNLKSAVTSSESLIGTALGKYSVTDTYTTAKTSAESLIKGTTYATASEFEALIKNLSTSGLSLNVPQSGKYYNFKCVKGNRYILSTLSKATNMADRLATSDENADVTADCIFYLNESSLVGYNNGYYISKNSSGSGFPGHKDAGSTSGTTFTFVSGNVSEGSLCINFENNTRGVYGAKDGYIDAQGANSTTEEACRFIVTEVTELPLTIGANGWSSFSAPVAVSVPNEVKAYYAPNDPAENKLVLEEITNGIIPANTGVVIKGTEGATVNFSTNITGTATDLSNNKLVCNWYANKIGTGESTNTTDGLYAFATKTNSATGAKTTGFMKLLTEITLLGHKCYLNTALADADDSAYSPEFIPISLTDDPTGIESAETTTVSDSNAPIYDLQGRKVTSTTKGGMYIQNGKVFIAM